MAGATSGREELAGSGTSSTAPMVASSHDDATAHGRGARFDSILFPGVDVRSWTDAPPDFFHDLSLGGVVEAITAGRAEYDLAPLFYVRLEEPEAVAYRQEVMRDMEQPELKQAVGSFARHMRTVRKHRQAVEESYYELEKQRWLLAAVEVYVESVEGLLGDLASLALVSPGMRVFRDFLRGYTLSSVFRSLAHETRTVAGALEAIRYCVFVREGSVTVRPYENEPDYSAAVEETFRKFRQGTVRDYRQKKTDERFGLNHVEAQILERVALLDPEAFEGLARFCQRYADFIHPLLARFDREIQFYAAYLDYVGRFRSAGLPFCYPQVASGTKEILANGSFDLALADKLVREGAAIVCNDFFLRGPERVLVVTGPNQGGKTTFARMFGQLHYFASLGCPVPGREAKLLLCDQLLTHFEREESIANLRGKLEDDLVRIHDVLGRASPNSIVIVNEIFSSTALEDALFLGREIMKRLMTLDLLCVCVTFLDELATLGEKAVSLVSGVDPHDSRRRTFKVERRAPDGLAYALSVAEQHRVTERWIQERVRP